MNHSNGKLYTPEGELFKFMYLYYITNIHENMIVHCRYYEKLFNYIYTGNCLENVYAGNYSFTTTHYLIPSCVHVRESRKDMKDMFTYKALYVYV